MSLHQARLHPTQAKEYPPFLARYLNLIAPNCDSGWPRLMTSSPNTRSTMVGHPSLNTRSILRAPVQVPYQRQNPLVREEEDKHINQMMRHGIIQPSTSPWAATVVMVKKKDSSGRFCVDYRKRNDITIKDAHPLPWIDDTLEALYGAKIFTTLDMKAGYWQIPIQEEDKPKTAFRTSSGRFYECEMMGFGLCNAPATFS